MATVTPDVNLIYRLSRRGRKLYVSDEQKLLLILPKDVSERTWMEIMQREKSDLLVLDIREEIVEEAIQIGFHKYIESQEAKFTCHCASEALLMLINWHFYRHDPGEDPHAYPPCHIPKRQQSWTEDEYPEPSPKDTLVCQSLNKIHCAMPEVRKKWPSNSSLDMPVVEKIPKECRFPGNIQFPSTSKATISQTDETMSANEEEEEEEEVLEAISEVLQQVTDYVMPELKTSPQLSSFKLRSRSTSITASLQGAGDSNIQLSNRQHQQDRYKLQIRRNSSKAKSKMLLPPIDKSGGTVISDCYLRTPRLETLCQISSEKFDLTPPPTKIVRRKVASKMGQVLDK